MTIKKSNAEDFVFVVMPFEDVFNDIYFNNIEKCLSSENYLVKRADSFLDQRNILKDIVQNIDRANLIIADVTKLNPNVIYELGIAHSLLKPTVIITQDIDTLPFDLRSYRVIPYASDIYGRKELESKLLEIIRQKKEGTILFESPVSDFAPQYKTREILLQYFFTKEERERLTGIIDEKKVNQAIKGIQEATGNWVAYVKERISIVEKFSDATMNSCDNLIKIHEAALKQGGLLEVDKKKEGEIVDIIVKSMEDYCDESEKLFVLDSKNWKEFVKSTRELIFYPATIRDSKYIGNIVKYKIILDNYIKNLDKAIDSMSEEYLKFRGLRGYVKLDASEERVKSVDNKLKESYKIRQSEALRIRNLIEERLEI